MTVRSESYSTTMAASNNSTSGGCQEYCQHSDVDDNNVNIYMLTSQHSTPEVELMSKLTKKFKLCSNSAQLAMPNNLPTF